MLTQTRVDARIRAVFFRSLATLFFSGVPLVRALELLAEQQESPQLAEACSGLARKVSQGNYLSRAFMHYPDIFKPVHYKMVQSGEHSGQLHAVLLKLAQSEESQLQLQQNFRGALLMPLMVSALCLALAILAPPYLFGGLFQMIREVGGSLPWTTRLLMAFSGLVSHPGFYLAIGLLAGMASLAWKRLLKDEHWQFQALKLPVIGSSLRLYLVTHFTQNLASMLEVGVPLLVALEQAARALDAVCLDRVVERVLARLREGETLSRALDLADFFPPMLIQGVRASEEAGRLSSMLEHLHRLLAMDLEQRLDVATRTLEPAVLSLVGGIVAFTLLATLQPLLSVMNRL